MAIPAYRQIPGTKFVVDAFRYRPISQDKVYFLTHAHSDHYGGLTDTWSGGPIYCSEITASLVHLLTGVPAHLLRPTPLDVTTVIDGVKVTFIDANHCPGAAQVLFELQDGRRFIHCGDMRYSPALLANPHLQRFRNADAVFLDTTYAHPHHAFPEQEEAVEFVAARIHQLLQEDEQDKAAAPPPPPAAAAAAAAGQPEPPQQPSVQHDPGTPQVSHPQLDAESTERTLQEHEEVRQQQHDGKDGCRMGQQKPEEGVCQHESEWQEQQQQQHQQPAADLPQQETRAVDAEDDEEQMQQAQQQLGFKRLYLISTYVIGKERLLLSVAARTGRKLLVTQRKLCLLRVTGLSAEEVDGAFTTDPTSTPIRVVRWGHLGDSWPYFRPNFTNMEADRTAAGAQEVVGFVPTGWTYEMRKAAAAGGPYPFPVRTKAACSVWLVPYSEHSSFPELREYVGFIKPKQVIPTVGVGPDGPEADKKCAAILKHFRGLLDETANKAAFIARLGNGAAAKAGAGKPAPLGQIGSAAAGGSTGPGASTATAAAAAQERAGAGAVVDLVSEEDEVLAGTPVGGNARGRAAAGCSIAAQGADLEGFWELDADLAAATCADVFSAAANTGATIGSGPPTGDTEAVVQEPSARQAPAAAAATAAGAAAVQGALHTGAVGVDATRGAAAAAAASTAAATAKAEAADAQLLSLAPAGSLSVAEAQQLLAAASGDLNAAVNALLDRQAQQQRQQQQQQRSHASVGKKRPYSSKGSEAATTAAAASGSTSSSKKPRRQQKKGSSSAAPGQAAITAFFTSSRAKSPAQHIQQELTVAPVQLVPQHAAPKHRQNQQKQQQEQQQPDQGPADLQQHTKQEVGQQQHLKPSAAGTAAAAAAAGAASSVPRIVLPPLRKLSLHSQSRQRSQQQQRGLQQQQQDDQASAQQEQPAAAQHEQAVAVPHWRLDDQQEQPQPHEQQQEVQHWQVPSATAATKQQPLEQQEVAAAHRARQEGAANAAAWQALLPGNNSQRRKAGASSSTPVPASAPTKQAADSGGRDASGPQLAPSGVSSATPAPAAAAGGAAPGGSLSITSSADVVPAALRQATLLPLARYHPVDHAVWGVNQPAPYLALAVTLAAVDSTTKRNQIALGMTNFFRSLMLLSPQDVVPAAYLLCGRIGPEYESLELNIGGSVVSSALCEVCGVSRSQLSDMYKQHGDLGDVAQACRRKQTLLQAPQPLTISGFFDALHKLAAMSGQGATARRQAVVSKLLRAARDVETRYLVRTLIQCLRVGAGYRSVLAPLAKAALLHRSMLAEAANKAATSSSALDRTTTATPMTAAAHAASSVGRVSKAQLDAASAAVLAAYHRCPNIQVIADVLMSSGPEALQDRVQLSCGVPVKPMLARPCTGAADALKLLSGTTAAGAAAAAIGRVRPAQAAAAAAAESLQGQQQDVSDGGDESGDEVAADGSDDEFEPAAAAVTGQHSTSSTATLSTAAAAAGTAAPSGVGSAAGTVQNSAAASSATVSCNLSRNHSSSSFCVLAEYKYDGQRAQIHVSADRQVRIFSRNCDEHTGAFPDVVEAVLAAVDPQQLPVVLDAELVAVDRANGNRLRAFQELATRRRGSAAASATAPAAAAGTGDEAAGSRARGTKRPAAAAGLQAAGSRSGGARKVQQQKLRLQPAAAPSSSMQQSASSTEVTAASTAAADTQDGAPPPQQQQQDTVSTAAGKAGQASGGNVDVCVFVFDALCVAGRDLMSHSLRQRRAAAAAALTRLTPGVVQLAQGIEVQVGGSAGTPAPAVMARSGPSAVAAGRAADVQQHVDEVPGSLQQHPEADEVGAASASAAAAAAASCEPPAAAEGSDGAAGGAGGSIWAAAEQQLTEFLFSALDGGTEGLMLKLLDGPASGYAPAQRGLSWLKLKRDYLEGLADSLDLVPIGAWWGQGRKVKWFSPFLLAVYDRHTETFQSLCRVMSGFTDAFYAAATERLGATAIPGPKPYYNTGESCSVWFEPTEVWEVRGADLSISPVHRAAVGLIHPDRGIGLRFPRFLRVRPDKSPEEASGPDLVQELYNKQSRRIHQD